jgi:hypothetical protein
MLYAGIDYHKRYSQVHVVDEQGREVFEGSVTWPTHHISHRPNGARTRALATQSGAVAVLFKPFEEQPLLEAIARAFVLSKRDRI